MPPFKLPVETWADLENEPEAKALIKPWLYEAAITEISGKHKDSGKSTFTRAMIRALILGEPFLASMPPAQGNVYVLSEEHGTLKHALVREKLWGLPGLFFTRWPRVHGVAWADVCNGAIDEALARDCKLLVVDTYPRFTLQNEVNESDATHQYQAMAPLKLAAAEGLSVLIIRHDRKMGGALGQSSRGSTAVSAEVDIIVHIKRASGRIKTRRLIEHRGRIDEGEIMLDFDVEKRTYFRLDDESIDYSTSFHLPTSLAEFAALHQLPRSSARRVIERLLEEDALVQVSGSGKKGDPEKYLLSSLDSTKR